MLDVIQSESFERWLKRLKDKQAKARINARLRRASLGNLGDVRPVGAGLSEMRIHYGPGYRVYVRRIGHRLLIVLAGGDKRTQQADIETAKRIAKEWQE